MATMLDGVQEFLTPSLLSRVSSQTGESESAVSKGFTAVIPALLASIASRSTDTRFMNQVASLATTTASDPNALTAAKADTAAATGGWLSALSNGGLSSVTSAIARYAGVHVSSATSLLSFGAPLVLGYLGRMMRSDNLDAPSLAQRFQAERGSIAEALPAGFDALFPGAATPTSTVRADASRPMAVTASAVRHEPARSGWVVPAALVALAIVGLLWWGARDRAALPRTDTVASGIVETTLPAAGLLARSLPSGVTVNVPAGGMEDRLLAYLSAPTGSGASFDFDRTWFEGTTTTITPQSRTQVENVAHILKAYPRTRVVVAGYTDNSGDEAANLALSRGRAEAVVDALRNNGVPAGNMLAQGFGSRNPIAGNTTDVGRARNRRVTLTIPG